jgi:hypothetical protein
MGDLLLQAGYLRQRVQLAQAAGQLRDLHFTLPLGLFGLDGGSQRVGSRLSALGAMAPVKQRYLNRESRTEVVDWKSWRLGAVVVVILAGVVQ